MPLPYISSHIGTDLLVNVGRVFFSLGSLNCTPFRFVYQRSFFYIFWRLLTVRYILCSYVPVKGGTVQYFSTITF